MFKRIVPFIMMGIAIVALAFGIFLLAYLFLIGAMVGFVLFVISWVRKRFFPPKKPIVTKKSGRTIDSDDWKVL